ncbi:acyl carrier protein [Reichenbachiella agarivorans]|uniref:Acyl carrier protein n=1 Tax=Reichenbachiella agarivorans TaxID=2979464 RepID=A0ABY6CT58_9BACT|nr:acyl carrier protein [Reichenbachiella agarivorans]UXP33044.1 acyl carrier protein [Reichenbachiella agarivorans]
MAKQQISQQEEQIKSDLIEFIKSEILDASIEIDADTPLSDAGVDSFSVIELVLFLERKHGITIQEKDMLPQNFKSVASLAQCAVKSI